MMDSGTGGTVGGTRVMGSGCTVRTVVVPRVQCPGLAVPPCLVVFPTVRVPVVVPVSPVVVPVSPVVVRKSSIIDRNHRNMSKLCLKQVTIRSKMSKLLIIMFFINFRVFDDFRHRTDLIGVTSKLLTGERLVLEMTRLLGPVRDTSAATVIGQWCPYRNSLQKVSPNGVINKPCL